MQSRQQVIYAGQNWSTNIVGVNVDYQSIKSWPMKYGAFFTRARRARPPPRSARSGLNVANNLFGEDVDPTGVEVRIRNHVFKVLGVMGRQGRVVQRARTRTTRSSRRTRRCMKKLPGQRVAQLHPRVLADVGAK